MRAVVISGFPVLISVRDSESYGTSRTLDRQSSTLHIATLLLKKIDSPREHTHHIM